MNRWRCGSFLLILAVGCATAEIVKNVQELTISSNGQSTTTEQRQEVGLKGDAGKLDYETALRPALLQKRSIANIARLLLGGNVPPNHPLVKYPEPKAWNLASNIAASLPAAAASTLSAAASSQNGWPPKQNSALENIQQLFETKAKLIPYTGQVATGLTGLASVKGDLIKQIHSISTQAIAQAAAEAAARALAGAAAAHAVTNSIHSVVNPAQTGIKGGWSSYQSTYANPAEKPGTGLGPGDQPGPPYHSSSAHINHYQAPPSPYNPYQSTPSPLATLPSPVGYQQGPQQPYQNGYYTLYNTQPSASAAAGQTPYTPAPPVGHARPTLSPSTLIATTPSAPGGIFGRHASQSATSSLLSTISSLLSASTAAYNSAFTGSSPANIHQYHQQQRQYQQAGAILPNLLPSSSSHVPFSSSDAAAPSPASSIHGSAANAGGFDNAGLGYGGPQQSINSLSQGGSNYGGAAGSIIPSFVHNPASNAYSTGANQAGASPVNPSSYPFNQHVPSNAGANYAQPGTNPYNPSSVQSSSQFGSNFGATSGAGSSSAPTAGISGGIPNGNGAYPTGLNVGAGSPAGSYSTVPGPISASSGYPSTGASGFANGPGYPGFGSQTGSSPGHVGGWNTQHAGPSASPPTWHSTGSNVYSPGYPSPTPGNFNNPSGSYGGGGGGSPSPANFPLASGSSLPQQAYSPIPQNAYQSPALNAYAPAQSSQSSIPYSPAGFQQQQQQIVFGGPYNPSGFRNPSINSRLDTHDLSQSASSMGNDYDDDDDQSNQSHTSPRKSHNNNQRNHSYQPTQRRNRPNQNQSTSKNSFRSNSGGGRYPSPGKKRPNFSKKPSQLYSAHASIMKNNNNFRNGGVSKNGGKRVIPTGDKKGSHFSSSSPSASSIVDFANVDDYHSSSSNNGDGSEYSESEGFSMNHSQEYPHNKNRWRSKNPSGLGSHPVHNHHSNGGWRGKETESEQTSSTHVRGNGSKRVRPQSGQAARIPSKNHRNKKIQYKHKPHSKGKSASSSKTSSWTKSKTKHEQSRTKAEAEDVYGGRHDQQQQQSGAVEYKSRDVYTTLPEHVFRVGERPDVFLRPDRKRKYGGGGVLRPRLGETDGTSGSRSRSSLDGKSKKDSFKKTSRAKSSISKTSSSKSKKFTPTSYNDEQEEEYEVTSNSSEEKEKSFRHPSSSKTSQRGKVFKSVTVGGEDEEFINASEAVDETARADESLSYNNEAGFITASEEFDPEEREAFVDDVYSPAEDHIYHKKQTPHRRQDYYNSASSEDDVEDIEENNDNDDQGEGLEDDIDKK